MRDRITNIFAFAVLTLLWLGFSAALLLNRDMLNTIWQSFRSWPLIVQAVVSLLTLPVVLGLWIWQTSWSLWLLLLLVLGLAWVSIYTFIPRKISSKPEAIRAGS